MRQIYRETERQIDHDTDIQSYNNTARQRTAVVAGGLLGAAPVRHTDMADNGVAYRVRMLSTARAEVPPSVAPGRVVLGGAKDGVHRSVHLLC